jgi:hypothetical protein
MIAAGKYGPRPFGNSVAHQLAELFGQPVQRRNDHFFESAGSNLDHQPIVQRSAATPVMIAR